MYKEYIICQLYDMDSWWKCATTEGLMHISSGRKLLIRVWLMLHNTSPIVVKYSTLSISQLCQYYSWPPRKNFFQQLCRLKYSWNSSKYIPYRAMAISQLGPKLAEVFSQNCTTLSVAINDFFKSFLMQDFHNIHIVTSKTPDVLPNTSPKFLQWQSSIGPILFLTV